jgi:hypothetical protein
LQTSALYLNFVFTELNKETVEFFLAGQRIKSYGCHEKQRATCKVQFGLRKKAFYQHKWEKMAQF